MKYPREFYQVNSIITSQEISTTRINRPTNAGEMQQKGNQNTSPKKIKKIISRNNKDGHMQSCRMDLTCAITELSNQFPILPILPTTITIHKYEPIVIIIEPHPHENPRQH